MCSDLPDSWGVVLTPSLRPPDPLSLTKRGGAWFQRVLHTLTMGRRRHEADVVSGSGGRTMHSVEQLKLKEASQTPCSLQSREDLHPSTYRPEPSTSCWQTEQQNLNQQEEYTHYHCGPPTGEISGDVSLQYSMEFMEEDDCLQEDVSYPAPVWTEQTKKSASSSYKRLLCPERLPHSQRQTQQQVHLKQAHLSQTDAGTLKYSVKESNLVAKCTNKAAKSKFCPIFTNKKEKKATLSESTPTEKDALSSQASATDKLPLLDASAMTDQDLEALGKQLVKAEEIAAALIFSDNSSQLRELQVFKLSHAYHVHALIAAEVKRSTVPGIATEVEGVCLAYPTTDHSATCGSPSLQYAFLPLDTSNVKLDSWCRSTLIAVLDNVRLITFGAQELLSTLMMHFQLLHSTSSSVKWSVLDTQIGGWLLNPDQPPDTFAQLLEKFDMQQHAKEAVERVGSRKLVCKDLAMLGPLMVKLYQRLQANDLWCLFVELEVKLIPILAAMETQGIQVNTTKLLQYANLLKKKIAKVEANAHKAAGHHFSINSTNQLRQVLFDELHLDEMCSKKLSKTHVQKHKSTSEAVLTQLQDFHPLPALVLEYRQLCKVNATYVNGILPYISDGVLKPSWLHTGTATGRLASCNPNIQAFPKLPIHLGVVTEQYIIGKAAEEVKIDIREAVESRAGFTFLAADFKSIELCLLAHLCGDPVLMSFLNTQQQDKHDIFVQLASEWLGMRLEEVTQVEREKAKRVVYAVVYGVGKDRLGEILNVHASHAKELMTSFLAKFPDVQKFMQKTIASCRQNGFLCTIGGRKRWFPKITTAAMPVRSHIERQAVNFPVQGSAADICKCGMIKVMQMLTQDSPKTRLLLQIHDELLFEVADEELTTVTTKVKSVLEDGHSYPYSLKVPLEVRITTGKTWATLR